MPIEAVDVEPIAVLDDARHVVWERRTQIRAHFDDLRFAESRVERIGCAEELDRGTRADPARIAALDHRRADHVEPVAARHDIEGNARMQEAHASPKANIPRPQRQHFATHWTQLRERVARRPAAAVDDRLKVPAIAQLRPETHDSAKGLEPGEQRPQRGARVEVSFLAEKQAPLESSSELGLE